MKITCIHHPVITKENYIEKMDFCCDKMKNNFGSIVKWNQEERKAEITFTKINKDLEWEYNENATITFCPFCSSEIEIDNQEPKINFQDWFRNAPENHPLTKIIQSFLSDETKSAISVHHNGSVVLRNSEKLRRSNRNLPFDEELSYRCSMKELRKYLSSFYQYNSTFKVICRDSVVSYYADNRTYSVFIIER